MIQVIIHQRRCLSEYRDIVEDKSCVFASTGKAISDTAVTHIERQTEVWNFVESTALKAALVKSRTFPCREVLIFQLYFDNFSGLQMKTQS